LRLRNILVVAFSLLIVATILWHETIFQEGNPLLIASAIIRLELGNDQLVHLSDRKLIQKSGEVEILNSYLSEKGWVFSDRLGSGLFYQKDADLLFVHSRMYTRFYIVYELDRSLNH